MIYISSFLINTSLVLYTSLLHTQTHTRTHVRAWGILRGVVDNVLDCSFEASEFDLQVPYYVHFRISNLGKGMKILITPKMKG